MKCIAGPITFSLIFRHLRWRGWVRDISGLIAKQLITYFVIRWIIHSWFCIIQRRNNDLMVYLIFFKWNLFLSEFGGGGGCEREAKSTLIKSLPGINKIHIIKTYHILGFVAAKLDQTPVLQSRVALEFEIALNEEVSSEVFPQVCLNDLESSFWRLYAKHVVVSRRVSKEYHYPPCGRTGDRTKKYTHSKFLAKVARFWKCKQRENNYNHSDIYTIWGNSFCSFWGNF